MQETHVKCPRCGQLICLIVPSKQAWCAECCIREANQFAAGEKPLDEPWHHGNFSTADNLCHPEEVSP